MKMKSRANRSTENEITPVDSIRVSAWNYNRIRLGNAAGSIIIFFGHVFYGFSTGRHGKFGRYRYNSNTNYDCFIYASYGTKNKPSRFLFEFLLEM